MQCTRKTIEVETALLLSATNMCYKDVVLGVGSSLVMTGVRDVVTRVDLDIPAIHFDRLVKEGCPVERTDEGSCIIYNDRVRLFLKKPTQVTEVNGFLTKTLRYLHSYKIFLTGKRNRSEETRKADLDDIRKLESMIF